eukprot:13026-Heterococcus_DN1.PRE.1
MTRQTLIIPANDSWDSAYVANETRHLLKNHTSVLGCSDSYHSAAIDDPQGDSHTTICLVLLAVPSLGNTLPDDLPLLQSDFPFKEPVWLAHCAESSQHINFDWDGAYDKASHI